MSVAELDKFGLTTADWPLVSVVVPIFNSEKYIEACLDSILAQDYPALQVIVVDDGSDDPDPSWLNQYKEKILFRRQDNSGSAVARNLGVSLADGDFITFNDSDDLWAANRLKQQVHFLMTNPDYSAACGRFIAVSDQFKLADAPPQELGLAAELDLEKSGWTYLKLLETSIYHIDTLMVRCDLMKKIKFNPDYRRGQDFDFFLQLVNLTPIAQINAIYAFYRQNPTSITRKPYPRNYRAEIITAALERWGRIDQTGGELSEKKMEEMLSMSWYGHGYELFRAHWYRAAERSFRLSLQHNRYRLSSYRYLFVSRMLRLRDRSPRHAVG